MYSNGEQKQIRILDEIGYLFAELMRRQHNEYYLKNIGWKYVLAINALKLSWLV